MVNPLEDGLTLSEALHFLLGVALIGGTSLEEVLQLMRILNHLLLLVLGVLHSAMVIDSLVVRYTVLMVGKRVVACGILN